jgi:hypothetical protein
MDTMDIIDRIEAEPQLKTHVSSTNISKKVNELLVQACRDDADKENCSKGCTDSEIRNRVVFILARTPKP